MEKIDSYKINEPKMHKGKSYRGDFHCGCGDEVDQEFLSVHLNDCDIMQEQYGDLYNAFNVLIEDSPFIGTVNNLQAITTFFRRKLTNIIDMVSICQLSTFKSQN
jgi:hypothetical protein